MTGALESDDMKKLQELNNLKLTVLELDEDKLLTQLDVSKNKDLFQDNQEKNHKIISVNESKEYIRQSKRKID